MDPFNLELWVASEEINIHLLSVTEDTLQISSSCVSAPAWEYFCKKWEMAPAAKQEPLLAD